MLNTKSYNMRQGRLLTRYWNPLLALCFFLIPICLFSQPYKTKVVEFDWDKKDFTENKSRFPFDEPFTFRIINLPPEIQKSYINITITDISKKEKERVGTININDSVVDGSKVFNGIVVDFLPPNHYFKVDIDINEESKIKSKTRDSLIEIMSDDKVFIGKIQKTFFAKKYTDLSIEDFNKLYQDYFNDNSLTNYKINYESVKKEIRVPIGEALKNLLSIADRLLLLEDSMRKNLYGRKNKMNESLKKLKDTSKIKELQLQINRVDQSYIQVTAFFSPLFYISKSDSLPYLNLNSDETLSEYLKSNDFENLHKNLEQNFKNDFDSSFLNQAKDELKQASAELMEFNSAITKSIQKTMNEAYIINVVIVSVLGSNVFGDSEAAIYTSQTFGYGYSPQTDNGMTYFSFSFFSRPVNNSVPFSNVKGFWDNLKVRLCANVGLTLEDITTNKHGEISGLGSVFGDKGGLIGLGIRPWPFLKVDVNSLLYYMNDPNPLIANKKFVASPFFGVSVNLNIIKLLSGQANSLTTLQKDSKSNQ